LEQGFTGGYRRQLNRPIDKTFTFSRGWAFLTDQGKMADATALEWIKRLWDMRRLSKGSLRGKAEKLANLAK